MRVAGGEFRGKQLETPKGRDIRPTSDKVRQAIFNMIGSRLSLEGIHVLDAFCGSGALGLEALSRGAESCIFIDKSPQSLSLAKQNVALCEAKEHSIFLKKDSIKLGDRHDTITPADLIFLDPPYRQGLIEQAITTLQNGGWCASDCLWVIESDVRENLTLPAHYKIESEKKYGDTAVILAYSTPE